MCRATAEADHRTAVHRVVTHTKEQMAQQRTVDTIVPHTRTVQECLERADPHVARDQHVLFMVEVQLAERQVRTRRPQVDFEPVWARPTTRRPDTTQPRRTERADELVFVMRLGVRDELVPEHVAEHGAHLLGNARE